MATKKKNSDQDEKPNNAYFLSLELENVLCFKKKQHIYFSDDNNNPKQWTIILGDNGTGKTTILKTALSISPRDRSRVTREHIKGFGPRRPIYRINNNISNHSVRINYTVKKGLVIFTEENKGLIRADGREDGEAYSYQRRDEFGDKGHSNIFAFGASRRSGETSLSEQNIESDFITLFDETALLTNSEEWLLRSHYESLLESEFQDKRKQKLKKIKETLIQILPDVANIRFSEKVIENKSQPIVEFETPYGWVEAKDLSLGYRTSMAWMVDFASRMFDLYPDSENPLAEPAVVLIDEIDLHLHPKWQRDLLDWLSNLFPNTQFIVTTHSPLIVQSAAARDANFAVCRREGDHVVIDQSLDAVKNWRADQILTSDLFGLETARPKEIEQDLLERQQILSKAKLTKKDEKRLKEIETKVGEVPMMENPLYDKMMDVIFRASEKLEKGHKNGK